MRWEAPEVVVISESLAEQLWPGRDALGRRIRSEPFLPPGAPEEPQPWATVVGVVSDVTKGVGGTDVGDLYWSFSQGAPLWMNLVIRRTNGSWASANKGELIDQVESVLADLDPNVPFSAVRNLPEAVESATAPTRFLAVLFAVFASLALLLAIVGLYGVMAYAARQARKDVAIRMALGADARDVRLLFFRHVSVVLGLGLTTGWGIARILGGALGASAPRDRARRSSHDAGRRSPTRDHRSPGRLGASEAGGKRSSDGGPQRRVGQPRL